MVGTEWWLPELRALVSQGDLIPDVPFTAITSPPIFLKFAEAKKGRDGWEQTDQPTHHKRTDRVPVLVAYRPKHGLILTRDCELDKIRNTARILFAPVAPIDILDLRMQELILKQAHRASIPLPETPGLGICFADLRSISSIPASAVDLARRIASMTDPARLRVHSALVAFLLGRILAPDNSTIHDAAE